MGRSNLTAFLVVGLLVGAFAGYATRPKSTQIQLGPMKIEVTGNQSARGGGPITSAQMQHIALLTLVGGVIGLGLGFVSGKRK